MWWLPQSCWRDQVTELSKCMWINSHESNCDQQETEDEREQVDKCHLTSSLRWAVRDTTFCRAIWVSHTTHGQTGAQLMAWLHLTAALCEAVVSMTACQLGCASHCSLPHLPFSSLLLTWNSFFFKNIYLFIYLGLHWVLTLVHELQNTWALKAVECGLSSGHVQVQ